ncbi:unnamed protein product [Lactuca saligna]|uniref:UBA domain-containing protein n=1 Tax=Lactuca saligna TaxID=75948 RepID=A0AA35YJT7_LACSI|nr:unnamed protein product [Lactuca saligna]
MTHFLVLETEVRPSDVVCAINPETTPSSTTPNSNRLPNPGGAPSGADRTSGTSDMSQLLQNPTVSRMMQILLSNPQYMEQIVSQNPQLLTMFDSNPQLREMMQNPEVLRQLISPRMMNPTQTGASPGLQNNMGFDMLMSMFGGLGAGGMGVPNVPDVALEQLYATQLSQLQEMGFFDLQENIRVLCATSGNVYAAVERLLGKLWSMMVMVWHSL